MTKPTYRALRTVLVIISLLTALGGLLLIAGTKTWILARFPHLPPEELSLTLLQGLKELGGLALTLSLLLYFAARDPVRNIAIIDVFIAGLCILAVTPLISLYTLDVGRI